MKVLIRNFDLYDFLANKIIYYFEKSLILNDIEKEKLYLGLLTLLINIIKFTIICAGAVLFNLFKEVVCLILIFASLRLTSAGLHAKSSFACTVTSLIAFIGGSFLSVNFPISKEYSLIICGVLTILLFKYSPADTDKKPILEEKIRRKLKKQTLTRAMLFITLNLILLNTTLINLTMFAMMYQTISIVPITYKLLKRSYNNYEKYEV